jgi:MOSC domain-containing protein YiiM
LKLEKKAGGQMAKIYSIVYQTKRSLHEPPYRYNRTPAESVELVAGRGIKGDLKAGKSKNRQLNVMSYATTQKLAAEGYKTAPGELGEQIVIAGIDVIQLPKGTQLQIGEEAIIEIGKPRTPCEWFELVQGKSMEESVNRIGVLAKVLRGGMICIGDEVKVLAAEPV